ncbi:DUF2975 domain-containing protein [Citroniella saccharovorans]|uniref:DUF2975 domain-containing protein n=1 Tax=Citroniella saccharovorans TaxID=2053367 RepID=A0AAW9MS25_9FIRM|nr:DUF2975 domain-containing protein [Citroniella saccharovorans]MEB3428776.1 DUF2975 domain-containing protein [Citroniella saccharovorans]
MKKLNFLRAVLVMILLTVIYVAIFIMPEIAEGLALKYRDFSSYKNFFLIIVYISLVPVGLIIYSTFKLLNIIEKERKFDRKAIREFDIIKYSSAIGAFLYLVTLLLVIIKRVPISAAMISLLIAELGFLALAMISSIIKKLYTLAVELKEESDFII